MARSLRTAIDDVGRDLGNTELQYYRLSHLNVRAIDPQIVWDSLPSNVRHRIEQGDFKEVMVTTMALHAISALQEFDGDLAAYDALVESVVG